MGKWNLPQISERNMPIDRIQEDVARDSSVVMSSPGNKIPNPTRTPMGDYIVPAGGKPLTLLGHPFPGPSDYTPTNNPTKVEAPHYSIVGKPKALDPHRGVPGPFEYNTSGDVQWKNKKITLKGRERDLVEDQAARGNSNLGKYKVEYLNIGQTGPKFKIGTKPKPTDAAAVFQTPGPNYRPNSAYWGRGPQKSFGTSLKKTDMPEGPGPGDYDIPSVDRGPSHSFGMKLPEPVSVQQTVNKHSPAANTYNIGSTIGKASAISITGRQKKTREVREGPSPSSYYPRNKFSNMNRATSLAYKWFETTDPKHPGPADYKVYHVNLKKSPAFSCGQRTKHSYPMSVKLENEGRAFPGPGSYDLVKPFVKNDNPAFSFRKRLKKGDVLNADNENFPGPNAYAVEKREKAGAKRAPMYSMGRKTVSPGYSKYHPGPAEYHPVIKESGPKYTMTKRPKTKGSFVNPAPNLYTLPEAISGKDKGVVLKSRASPYVYSGHRCEKLEEPRPNLSEYRSVLHANA